METIHLPHNDEIQRPRLMDSWRCGDSSLLEYIKYIETTPSLSQYSSHLFSNF